MKVLVTGAAGFIGSHLVDRLLALGHSVVGFDNISYGSKTNLEDAFKSNNFSLVEGDIQKFEEISGPVESVDVVYHLAAFKIPRYSDALDTLLVNGLGSKVVLDACKVRKTRIIAASTSDVYGMNPAPPFAEDTSNSVIGPPTVRRWAYAVSKMYEEQLGFAFRERFKLPVTIVRFFGGYGPRHNLTWWGGPQSGFITKTLNNESLEVHGDGQQTRSFTYISDHVDGLASILTAEKADGNVFNLGTTEEIPIIELARLIWFLIRSDEPRINLVPYSNFGNYQDVRRRIPDLSKSRDLLGFEPKVRLKDGLLKTIDWQKKGTRQVLIQVARKPLPLVFSCPAYNEEDNIGKLMSDIDILCAGMGRPFLFMPVDDGSTDGTSTVIRQHPIFLKGNVRLCQQPHNMGVARAFERIFNEAAALPAPWNDGHLVTLEADNTSDLSILPEMIRHLEELGSDAVFASCYARGGRVLNTSRTRIILSKGANLFVKTLFFPFGVAYLKTLSSFYRAYKIPKLASIVQHYGEAFIVAKGFECMVEIAVKIRAMHAVITEVPMILDGGKRIGVSKLRIRRTIYGYLRLIAYIFLPRRLLIMIKHTKDTITGAKRQSA